MDSDVSAWTTGAAIFTFLPLYILILAGAGTLWMLYIKPVVTPGHRANARARAVADTPVPGRALTGPAVSSTADQDKAGE